MATLERLSICKARFVLASVRSASLRSVMSRAVPTTRSSSPEALITG